MPPLSPTVKYEVRDRVAWITLSRPKAMNALNRALSGAIQEAVVEATSDEEVLVLVLIGEGGRAFSAGADLKERARRDVSEGTSIGEVATFQMPGTGSTAPNALTDCPKPVIAAIDGYCLADGFQTALKCDIRIATEKSRFGMPEARRSLVAAGGVLDPERHVPLGWALWIGMTGSHMTGQEAYNIGLIQALVPDRDTLIAKVEEVANEIKQSAPLSVQAIKQIIKMSVQMPEAQSQRLAAALREIVDRTEDRLEGPQAFAQKRAPVWKMR